MRLFMVAFPLAFLSAALFGCNSEPSSTGGSGNGPAGGTGGSAGGTGGAAATGAQGGAAATGAQGGAAAMGGSAGGTGGAAATGAQGGRAGGQPQAGSGELVCDEQEFFPEPAPVAVMLLQDLSGSMESLLVGDTKWQHSINAITSLLTDPLTAGLGIRFGFDYFPDTAVNFKPADGSRVYGCGVDDPVVIDCDLNTGPSIIDWMNNHGPSGGTPLGGAINKFNDPAYAPLFSGATIGKYLVVISDGADSCGMDCVSNETAANWADPAQLEQTTLDLAAKDIKTIVIGFGDGVAPDQLNAIAQAGGVFETYFDAHEPQDLHETFQTIANAVVSCVWTIDAPGPRTDPGKVNFYLDNTAVPFVETRERCETENGWIWNENDPRTVEFCNDACDQLRSGVREISARFGCPSIE